MATFSKVSMQARITVCRNGKSAPMRAAQSNGDRICGLRQFLRDTALRHGRQLGGSFKRHPSGPNSLAINRRSHHRLDSKKIRCRGPPYAGAKLKSLARSHSKMRTAAGYRKGSRWDIRLGVPSASLRANVGAGQKMVDCAPAATEAPPEPAAASTCRSLPSILSSVSSGTRRSSRNGGKRTG